MTEPSLGDLHAGLAALTAAIETELKGVNARLADLELVQAEMVKQVTLGRGGLRVLLWVGGATLTITGIAAALWKGAGG